ncbi:putative 60S acidic ribosomal protein P2 [Trypanosoma rangeli]|uniref:Putative 60S acidic ribosomal protein P2 n=1 Tax=Trypanosoma rangeli TaxID=5698 RepID=A0A3R7NK96_TRYRA|nr:putative 60S acidic ribosomal protein P2 [Trypanosoma rangeli]XP_029240011.1 putative 60S acidic ribosomal protein P2 [Trypanosoma rangeli]RNF07745.1 putative 60S acidic ribosomal protein P2 [Trypanosoma rangeli]RNF07746.1 putative 60S acidic ribosomal protein P2 [Trypanosoma rangeli]|eukprot:RNF07745.1 putative 60S acidic ribosomal protein P2 [Trypanosoma rangeli]
MDAKVDTNDTLACTYACLMLNDAGLPITAESIEVACNAAGLKVRNTLPILFARFLEKKPLESLFAAAAAKAPAEGAVAAAAAGGAAPAAAAAAPAKEEKEEEEDDDDMGFGLFD